MDDIELVPFPWDVYEEAGVLTPGPAAPPAASPPGCDELREAAQALIDKFSSRDWAAMEAAGTETRFYDARHLLPLRAALARLRAGQSVGPRP
jgi:hypothetical protein